MATRPKIRASVKNSPFKNFGNKNPEYVNPSLISHDCFYEPNYENRVKKNTPQRSPLGSKPKGYGEYDGYRLDRHSKRDSNRRSQDRHAPSESEGFRLYRNSQGQGSGSRRSIDRQRRDSRSRDRSVGGGSIRRNDLNLIRPHQIQDQDSGYGRHRKSRTPSRLEQSGYSGYGHQRRPPKTPQDLSQSGYDQQSQQYSEQGDKQNNEGVRPLRPDETHLHHYKENFGGGQGHDNAGYSGTGQALMQMEDRSPVHQHDHPHDHQHDHQQMQEDYDQPARRRRSSSRGRSQLQETNYNEHSQQNNGSRRGSVRRSRRRSSQSSIPREGQSSQGRKRRSSRNSRRNSRRSVGTDQGSVMTYTGKPLVCNNCVNKDLMKDKEDKKKQEEIMDKINHDNLQIKMMEEAEMERVANIRKKQRFKEEAMEHWEQAKAEKELEKERGKEKFKVGNVFEDDERYKMEKNRAKKMRNNLRRDLKKQIRDKTREKRDQDEKNRIQEQENKFTIGGGYVNRYLKLKEQHNKALREQIAEKEKKQADEALVDKEYQKRFENEMRRVRMQEEDDRVINARRKKEMFISEIEKMKKQKLDKQRREQQEKDQEIVDVQRSIARDRELQTQHQQMAKKKEDQHLRALQDQIEEAQKRRQVEQEWRQKQRSRPFLQDKQAQKMYDCMDCNGHFPRNQVNLKKSRNARGSETNYDEESYGDHDHSQISRSRGGQMADKSMTPSRTGYSNRAGMSRDRKMPVIQTDNYY